MKCRKHPSYQGIMKPRSGCMACWCIYIQNNFSKHKEVLTMDEVENLIEMMGCECSIEHIFSRLKLSD